MHGVTGVPLSYVIRNTLDPPLAADDPAFGETDLAYTSIDLELILQAPILHVDANLSEDDDNLEANGPFDLTFLTDTRHEEGLGHPPCPVLRLHGMAACEEVLDHAE